MTKFKNKSKRLGKSILEHEEKLYMPLEVDYINVYLELLCAKLGEKSVIFSIPVLRF